VRIAERQVRRWMRADEDRALLPGEDAAGVGAASDLDGVAAELDRLRALLDSDEGRLRSALRHAGAILSAARFLRKESSPSTFWAVRASLFASLFALWAVACTRAETTSPDMGGPCFSVGSCTHICLPSNTWPGGFCTRSCSRDAECPVGSAC